MLVGRIMIWCYDISPGDKTLGGGGCSTVVSLSYEWAQAGEGSINGLVSILPSRTIEMMQQPLPAEANPLIRTLKLPFLPLLGPPLGYHSA